MAEPLTGEELDRLVREGEDRARYEKSLRERPPPNYTPADMSVEPPPEPASPPPLAPAGPPPPPAPVEHASPASPPLGQRINKGIGIAAPYLRPLLGETPPEPREPTSFERDKSQNQNEEGAAAAAREASFYQAPGAGVRVIPGGMMPNKRGFETTEGIPVPPAALANFDEAAAAGIAGNKGIAEAEKAYGVSAIDVARQKMQAEDLAALEHQKVQADRAAYTQGALARINDFNNAANAKIDTNKGWRDKGALGSFFGLISLFLGGFASTLTKTPNTAAEMFENVTNREIKAQEHDIANAQHRAGAEQTLLGLHMSEFKDRDMAVDATKKGIYEKMLAMLEAERARKGVNEADPQYLLAKQALLNHVAEQQNKLGIQVAGKHVLTGEDKMTAPTVIGGASTKGMEPTDTIQIPPFSGHGEPKRVLIDNKQVMNELHKVEYIRAEIHAINEDAIAALHRFEDPNLSLAQKREIGLDLSRLAEKKAALGSVEVQQGVLKEAEYWRALTKQVGFTGYSAEVPTSAGEAARELARLAQFAHATGSKSERERIVRFLQSQDTENYKQFTKAVESAGGREVKLGYTTDAQGFKHPVQTEVGRPFDASSIPAPKRPIQ